MAASFHGPIISTSDIDAWKHLLATAFGLVEVGEQSLSEAEVEPLHIRAVNMGSRRDQPYFWIIHYGLPAGYCKSLHERARLPNRGLVGATVRVDDIEALHSVVSDRHVEIVAPPSTIRLLPFGDVTSMAVRAPHGILHQIIQVDGTETTENTAAQ